ncbi:beta-propeller fold lactonase family protein [Flagellimonas meishanensis]|uniref:YVTN family beta-propeller repeat protein n=1 Tax=Flagellimonas meishanensis TaxID=2873264 RepID=UPI001CA79860|nr:beta-propeller fold lactonase family protein [[Muricauda] meishanensis]
MVKQVLLGVLFTASSLLLFSQETGAPYNITSFIATENVEYGATFNQSQDTVYFVKANGQWGIGNLKSTIYFSSKSKSGWSAPEIASFSGEFDDGDPHLALDGQSLFFTSKRPPFKSTDIWRTDKTKDGVWSAPVRIEAVSSDYAEYSPVTDSNNNLYFASDRPGGLGQGDLYVSLDRDGEVSAPINLGPVINSSFGEWNLTMARDSIMIFESSQRSMNKSSFGDLYISFLKKETWTAPQNLEEINTTGSDLYPFLDHKGVLYFTSSDSLKSKDTNIYSVEAVDLLNSYYRKARNPQSNILVVNRSSHKVSVVTMEGDVIKDVKVGKGPHEISMSKDQKVAFVANYGSYPNISAGQKSLQWIEEKENTITKITLPGMVVQTFSIAPHQNPHGILTNTDGSIVWVTDENEGKVLEMDGNDGSIKKEYETMKGSHIIKATSDFKTLFVSNIESNTISIIDIESGSVRHMATPKGPEGLGVTPDNKRLWVLCNGADKIMVLDIESLEEIKIIESPERFPIKLAFTKGEAWITNSFGRSISIYDMERFALLDKIDLQTTALGITASQDYVFVALPRKNSIRVFKRSTREVVKDISVGKEPDGLIINYEFE